jgi:transposase
MQMQLPIFPVDTIMINSTVGVYKRDDFVYYLHNGSPIFCHSIYQLNSYRYILANLTTNGLCTCSQISKAFGIHVKNVQRYKKALEENGFDWFFNRKDNRGQCHKFIEEKLKEAQELINKGFSQHQAAKKLGVSEGSIRYHLRKGTLKKKSI